MNFSLRVVSATPHQSLLDNFTPPAGILYFKEVLEMYKLPKDFPVGGVFISDSCHIGGIVCIELDSMNALTHEHLTINQVFDKYPKLSTVEYFMHKNTVDIMMRPGHISQYITEYPSFCYTDNALRENKKSKGIRKFFGYTIPTLICGEPQIASVRLEYKFDEYAFVNDWIKNDFPLSIGTNTEAVV